MPKAESEQENGGDFGKSTTGSLAGLGTTSIEAGEE